MGDGGGCKALATLEPGNFRSLSAMFRHEPAGAGVMWMTRAGLDRQAGDPAPLRHEKLL
jgi:hypothetical protein